MRLKHTLLVFGLLVGVLGCKDEKIHPLSLRYHWLTSASAVSLNDFKAVLSAPSTFSIVPDDCPGVSTDALQEDLAAIDTAIRVPSATEFDYSPSFWTGSVTSAPESWFSFVSTEGGFSAALSTSSGSAATLSSTPGTNAAVNAAVNSGTLQLVFANVRRRVDLSENAHACLARAALRACTVEGHGDRVYYVQSILYGALVRLGSSKLKASKDARVTMGQPFEFTVKANFEMSDITGGWIGRLNSPDLVTATEVRRAAGKDAAPMFDFPEILELIRSQRYREISERLDHITQEYGAIAAELREVRCSPGAADPKTP
jgi:hypothetical protein